jgi:peptide/nickel transport system ATP-binding protein
MMQASRTRLRLSAVTHEFQLGGRFGKSERIRAVDNVTLEIGQGEVLAIVGESGSGKTTLAKIMLGLLTPQQGTVELDGVALSAFSPKEKARRIQLVFQDPNSSLNPMRTIGSILMQPLQIAGGRSRQEIESEAHRMLNVVSLPRSMFDRYPGQISGGQKQRIAIARALITRPQILVCDEPTSALDVSVQAQILNLLLDLREEFGLTYVFISHNLSVVRHIANRVAVIYRGKIVEEGETADIFETPGHAYTRTLLQSIMSPKPRGGIPGVGPRETAM